MKKIVVLFFFLTLSISCYATSLADTLSRGYGTPVTYWYWYAWQGEDGNFYNGGCQPGSYTQVSTDSFVFQYYYQHGYAPISPLPAVALRTVGWDADTGYQHIFIPTTGTDKLSHRDSNNGNYFWEHWSRQTDSANLQVNHYRRVLYLWNYISGPHTVNYCNS
ncbi:MAG TPA: hypothetical protein PKH10_02875 [bacterium]|nr:hypothetical protein [bacterium]